MPDLAPAVVPAGRMRERAQPVLVVDELTLRPWRHTDAACVLAAYRDPAVQRWHVRSMTRSEAQDWVASWSGRWAAGTGASWAVCAADEPLGRVGLNAIDLAAGSGEAAYWVLPSARGRGVAPRALRSATAWMFDQVGLHRVELRHSTGNEPSCRVADKAGYAPEGTERQAGLHADGWHDMHRHARLKRDGPLTPHAAP